MEILKNTISDVHFQHALWLNELSFYKQEMEIFKGKLESLAREFIGNKEIHMEIEQFQNRFRIQRNELDILKHDINENENEAVEAGKINIRRLDYEITEKYVSLSERMEMFKKLYNELKDDFHQFIVKWA